MVKTDMQAVEENSNGNVCDLSCLELKRVPVDAIKQNKYITILNLHKNNLTLLGIDFAMLTNIVQLDLSTNALTSLPHNFGDLINLMSLNLYNNNLINVPISFGNLKNLHFLDLRCNALGYELDKIAGKCASVRECEECAIRVVEYFRNSFRHLTYSKTLDNPKQANTPLISKQKLTANTDNHPSSAIRSTDYICVSQSDESFSEISFSDFSLLSDEEFEENTVGENETHSARIAEEDVAKPVSGFDVDTFNDFDVNKLELMESCDHASTEIIVDKTNEDLLYEGVCDYDELHDGYITTENQDIDTLKPQAQVEVIVANRSKKFLKLFLYVFIPIIISATIYFIGSHFNINLSLSKYFSFSTINEKDLNAPNLIIEENVEHNAVSIIQDDFPAHPNTSFSFSTIKMFVTEVFLGLRETLFEKLMRIFYLFT
ncbi:plant intracellular Ras-group-related LRR protein 4-like [Teleopsis dalmanni]|uniref:plant intracellular Ras-group-related LRR protein 4-like n=1 Tax=Teleopsis dalmanni TaxID=139649 RepID=UPI0018CC7C37|nr:plant intracellular Ras-group-related LRR protein 4-like [Teleopsis dalmanni]XP_037928266.1 plant intracellular Ras-group-related LRR protein 4-like [Teleopsis dalmanni]